MRRTRGTTTIPIVDMSNIIMFMIMLMMRAVLVKVLIISYLDFHVWTKAMTVIVI